jgi:hypothetical protein
MTTQKKTSESKDDGAIRLKGIYTAVLHSPDGHGNMVETDRRVGENIITTVGKSYLAFYLQSAACAAATFTMVYAAIGTDATGEAVGDTALGTEVARHTGTASYSANAIYEVVATFATGSGTGAITEYGILDTNTGGTLLSRDTESAINKGASDTLTVTYQLTFS